MYLWDVVSKICRIMLELVLKYYLTASQKKKQTKMIVLYNLLVQINYLSNQFKTVTNPIFGTLDLALALVPQVGPKMKICNISWIYVCLVLNAR